LGENSYGTHDVRYVLARHHELRNKAHMATQHDCLPVVTKGLVRTVV
jgi:hypothetical protein